MTSRSATRAVLATTAVATAALLAASAGAPALAATTATPAKGTGTSGLQVLTLTAGGHTLSIGGLALVSDTIAGTPLAEITVTPAVADGTPVGEQTITPADSPATVDSQTTPTALDAVASLSSPAFTATASDAPETHAGSTSLGSISVLGIDVPVNGTVDLGSAVSGTQALAQKTVVIEDLALPTVAELLAALGLDVDALPVGTLTELVDSLGITTAAIDDALADIAALLADVDAAQAAVDAANVNVDTAQATATAAAAAVTAATGDVTAATTAATAATAAVNTLLGTLITGVPLLDAVDTVDQFLLLSTDNQNLIKTALGSTFTDALAAYTSAQGDLTDANAALAAANAALTAANAALDLAQALIDALAAVAPALALIDPLALDVLTDTPLLSLDSLTVSSKALTTSNVAGGQVAEVNGGTIEGLNVLGTDVLDIVFDSSTVDVVDLVGDSADQVTALIGDITGTLSDVLSTVPGFPALEIPAPQIELMTATTDTSIVDGFGKAVATVTGLTITLPAITLPDALALPGADLLGAFEGVTQVAGALTSAPISMELASLSDQSAYAPAVVPAGGPGAPTGGTPGGLAPTGLPVGVAVLAVLLVAGGVALRRRQEV